MNLAISVHTVHTHVARVYHKLGVSSHVDLVIRVIAEGAVQSLGGEKAA